MLCFDYVRIQIVEGQIITCDPKELVNDEHFGENHVRKTILNYKDKYQIMMIWKWLLSQIVYHG
jgi:hypothetical protein